MQFASNLRVSWRLCVHQPLASHSVNERPPDASASTVDSDINFCAICNMLARASTSSAGFCESFPILSTSTKPEPSSRPPTPSLSLHSQSYHTVPFQRRLQPFYCVLCTRRLAIALSKIKTMLVNWGKHKLTQTQIASDNRVNATR